MQKAEIAALGDAMLAAVKGAIARAESALTARLEAVEAAFKALPVPKDGEDGKSVHPDTVQLMVREAADKLTAALPKPKDGADGFGLDDFSVDLAEDGRTLCFKFQRGEMVKEKQIRLAVVLDRGLYAHDGNYMKGDCVTSGGSFWIAQRDDPQGRPNDGGTGTDWRLAVKRGRDGKDLTAGPAARTPVRTG